MSGIAATKSTSSRAGNTPMNPETAHGLIQTVTQKEITS